MSQQAPDRPYVPDTATIAAQNDAFRRFECLRTGDGSNINGRVVATHALSAAGDAVLARALQVVGTFETFEPDNDPDGSHDFGAFEIDGMRMFWKIDLFEANSHLRWGAETPDDLATTERVLTIMLASDW